MVNKQPTYMPYMRASGNLSSIIERIDGQRHGILDGGRTRIRTRVAGLEGQSDIQLHYTSNQPEKYLFDEL